MFENRNQEVLKELAKENLKAHTARNVVVILAVFLTTVLITSVFTAGLSMVSTGSNAVEQTPGPESDGYIIGSREHYEKLTALPEVEWADYVRVCSRTALHNSEFGGKEVRLFAPDTDFYKNNHVLLKKGAFPEKDTDIMISDTLAEYLGLEEIPGQPYPLKVMITEGNTETEKEIQMQICGIYQNPLFGIASLYEEIYTSAGFITAFNPQLRQEENIIYVKLGNLNPLLMKTDVNNKLSLLSEEVGANGYSPGKTRIIL